MHSTHIGKKSIKKVIFDANAGDCAASLRLVNHYLGTPSEMNNAACYINQLISSSDRKIQVQGKLLNIIYACKLKSFHQLKKACSDFFGQTEELLTKEFCTFFSMQSVGKTSF